MGVPSILNQTSFFSVYYNHISNTSIQNFQASCFAYLPSKASLLNFTPFLRLICRQRLHLATKIKFNCILKPGGSAFVRPTHSYRQLVARAAFRWARDSPHPNPQPSDRIDAVVLRVYLRFCFHVLRPLRIFIRFNGS